MTPKMKTMKLESRAFLSALFIFGLFSLTISVNLLHAQEEEKKDVQPKIIFKKSLQPDSLQSQLKGPDTTCQKVIFKKSALLKSEKIELLSSKQFKLHDETRMIGDKGMNLKKAMGQNPEAVALVDKAYQKHSKGKALMVLGGVVMVVGYAAPLLIAQSETTTGYWSPGVTAGAIIAGVGLSKQSGLTKNLQNAVKAYNDRLAESQPK